LLWGNWCNGLWPSLFNNSSTTHASLHVTKNLQIIFNMYVRAIERKLRLFGHICRMEDNRKFKKAGVRNEQKKQPRRPCRQGGRMTLSAGVRLDYTGAEQSSSRPQKVHYKTNSGHQRAHVPSFRNERITAVMSRLYYRLKRLYCIMVHLCKSQSKNKQHNGSLKSRKPDTESVSRVKIN